MRGLVLFPHIFQLCSYVRSCSCLPQWGFCYMFRLMSCRVILRYRHSRSYLVKTDELHDRHSTAHGHGTADKIIDTARRTITARHTNVIGTECCAGAHGLQYDRHGTLTTTIRPTIMNICVYIHIYIYICILDAGSALLTDARGRQSC